MSITDKMKNILAERWWGSKSDLSIQSLIISNLIVAIWALIERWPIFTIMWIYWVQSASIGIFWFVKMLTLKKFSTKDFQSGGKPVKATTWSKIHVSVFFLLHYGFFHFGFALAISSKPLELRPIVLAGSIFFVNRIFSFFHNREWDTRQKQNLGKLMFFPYMRVIPMHVTLWGAGILHEKFGITMDGRVPLAVFLFLKTVADVVMYVQQLRGFSDWPSSKLDNAGPLVQLLSGKTTARKFAQKIYNQMKKAYVGKHEYRTVNAGDFPHLNLKYYTRTTEELRTKGFAMLGDIEDMTLSKIHPQFQTFIRCLVNKEGTVQARIYYICNEKCPKILHVLDSALSAKVIDLQTEFSNGCFFITTNATETLATTPRIMVEYSPSDALVTELLEIHKNRVQKYVAQNPKIHPVPIRSLEEAIDSANRQNMILSAYGKSIPGILWEINKIAERELQGTSIESVVYEMRKLQNPEENKPND